VYAQSYVFNFSCSDHSKPLPAFILIMIIIIKNNVNIFYYFNQINLIKLAFKQLIKLFSDNFENLCIIAAVLQAIRH
jgi:hypothetical protein